MPRDLHDSLRDFELLKTIALRVNFVSKKHILRCQDNGRLGTPAKCEDAFLHPCYSNYPTSLSLTLTVDVNVKNA